jgi:hypothetical protein
MEKNMNDVREKKKKKKKGKERKQGAYTRS